MCVSFVCYYTVDGFAGKVEIITGVGKAVPLKLSKWDNPNRPISDSGEFLKQQFSTITHNGLFV